MFAKHRNMVAFLFYFFFFALLFLQLPLRHEISGNCDSWLALTYSARSLETLKSLFSGEETAMAMFPAEDPAAYGESAPGMQLFIMFFKAFGLGDHWTNYLFITLILALTAFGIFVFTGNFTKSFPAGLFAGFCFTCSNMVFAHIDDSVIIFFFFPALALHLIYRHFEEGKRKHLIISSVMAGLEIYFSFYVFFYQFLMVFVLYFFLAHRNKVKRDRAVKELSLYSAIAFLIAAPNFAYYLNTLYRLDFVPVFESFYTAKMASFNLIDTLLVLPGNLIYPNIGQFFNIPLNWGFVRHYNFIGLLPLALFIYSLFKWNSKNRLLFIMLAAVSVFFACGPVFMFNMKELFYSPLYIFYKPLPVLKFLRVAVRAYFIFLFAVSVSAALSFERICRRVKHRRTAVALFFAFCFLENTPVPLKGFDATLTEKVPEIYKTVKEQNIKRPLILELPAEMNIKFPEEKMKMFADPKDFVAKNSFNPQLEVKNMGMFVDSWDDLFQYNREIIYTNWQNSHKTDSINGVNGYFPTPRMIFQYHINRLPDPGSFEFLRRSGVNFVVWHEFMKIKADSLSLSSLESSPCLRKIAENSEGSALFRILDCKSGR
ncbi:glycosyltransferase family 39 protein [bacterium]|nr:glycosyltransferase family 39 protein [bacterium]